MVSGIIGSTYIFTEKGLIKIAEVNNTDKVYTISVNNQRKENVKIEPIRLTHKYTGDIVLINMEDGNNLFISKNHRVLSKTQNGEYSWKKVSDMSPGMVLIKKLVISNITSEYQMLGDIPFKEDLAYFIGYCFANGFVSADGKNILGWTSNNNDEKLNQKLVVIAQRIFNSTIQIINLPNEDLFLVENQSALDFLNKNGIVFNEKDFNIPNIIYLSPQSVIKSFISGFIASNKLKKYDISSYSKNFISGISLLLTSIGLKSKIYHFCGENDLSIHIVSIDYDDYIEFEKIIKNSFYKSKKVSKLTPIKITSINYSGPKEIFDLTIQETPSYIANGYVIHNHS